MKSKQYTESVYIKIELWDLLDSNVYIKIRNPLREEFFRYLLKISGGYKKLSKKVGITFGHIYDQRIGKYFTPLKLINKFLYICPENKRPFFKNNIEKNIGKIKLRSISTPIKNPKFPIRFSPILARIAGHLVGDGGINNSLIVHYTNTHPYLLNEFHKGVLKIFGNVKYGKFSHSGKKHVKTIWFPRIIGLLLSKMFGKQVKESKHIPKIIFKADDKSKSAFLSALFDDEGCVHIQSYTISVLMNGKCLMEDVKKLLKNLGINTGRVVKIKRNYTELQAKYKSRTQYLFYISGKFNLKQFSKLVNFSHPEKKEKLKILIQKYQ